ncbi:hypothetical protein AMECASPLE_037511 [Ameca splendens]|uniref:Uncharacterized protein n=1 Tax=Ameca splendens TaxID=208324 RepID=A0ABV0ZSY1_9TELE
MSVGTIQPKDFCHQTPVHTSLELFRIKCINLLLAQLGKGMAADFLWRHYPNKAQFRKRGGSRGLPAYKHPPFHHSSSFHAGLQGDRIGEAQSTLNVFAGKRHKIQLDPRSHTIIDHMPS